MGALGASREDPSAIDALMRKIRWVGCLMAVVQFALYTPPSGHAMPFSRWWGALPLVLLAAVNVAGLVRVRRRLPADEGWVRFQLVWDSAVIVVVLLMFSFDDSSALWALLILPVLEAATRGSRRQTLTTFFALCIAYVVREGVVAAVYPYNNVTLDSVTYRLAVLGIVSFSVASLADRLTRQIMGTASARSEADQLRALAVATRLMSSLDVATVVREVTQATEHFGFSRVELRSDSGVLVDGLPRNGGVMINDRWFLQMLQATSRDGIAVLAGDEADLELADGEALVVARVSTRLTTEALLVGRHGLPVPTQHLEGFHLVAEQASSALDNAQRYEERRAFQNKLAHQATHDSLTGLPNRALLNDRAQTAIARSRRTGSLVSVMFIDLDRFKEINDVLGHSVGDALLISVASRLSELIRPEDTCARVGGDEFVVVCADHANDVSVLELAHRLRAALHAPFQVEGIVLDIEASIGIAWSPEHGDDVADLLRRADSAMYAAKSRKEGVVSYRAEDDQIAPMHLSMLGDLRRALEAPGQLQAWFQPIVVVSDHRLAGAEALLRWDHPTSGRMQPGDFIPMAEGTALIHQLTDHVLDLALESMTHWPVGSPQLRLSVNLSPRNLLDASLATRVEALLSRHGTDPRQVRFEITESAVLADPTRAVATMHRLTALGVGLSIDDFGTGFSSMSHLKNLPVDQIKIDRSFVTDMLRSSQDRVMVRSMIDLAHGLGMHVVAEGVEDADTLSDLETLGCDLAQGYHIGPPVDREAFHAFAAGPSLPAPRTERVTATPVVPGGAATDSVVERPLTSVTGTGE